VVTLFKPSTGESLKSGMLAAAWPAIDSIPDATEPSAPAMAAALKAAY
jgi:hypothetical protein